jgi:sphinganine-1-phosphate aldolase
MVSNFRVCVITAIFILIVTKLPRYWRQLRIKGLIKSVKQLGTRLALKLPRIKRKLKDSEDEAKKLLHEAFLSKLTDRVLEIPKEGLSKDQVMQSLEKKIKNDHHMWVGGKISGTIYTNLQNLQELNGFALKEFMISNPLHPDIFPSIRQMESEIVQMAVNLYNGCPEACGTVSSGGTESIMLAMLAYRQWGRERGILRAEVIVPKTAHAAFKKACYYFDMDIIEVDVNPTTFEADVSKMRSWVSKNTVAIVGSYPNFSNGVVDPMDQLSTLATKYNINLHADCCLGGFLVPFMQEAGYKLPLCDFRLPGVTSISCDPHKYGLTPKGISVIMYRNTSLRQYQYFVDPEWVGGIYATHGISGSRPGNISAAAWATMMHMGREGYVESTKRVVEASYYVRDQASKIPGIKVMGTPLLSVIGFMSNEVNIYAVASEMHKLGWSLNSLQEPSAFHLCVTLANCGKVEEFINDLKRAVESSKVSGSNLEGGAVIYGMTESLPDKSVVSGVTRHYVDYLFAA